MKKILFTLSICSVVLFSQAQSFGDNEYSPTPMNCETFKKLKEMGEFTILDTLEKPMGYIIERGEWEYYIAVKGSKQWVVGQLEAYGVLNTDSTQRVNVNDKGSDELLLFTLYSSQTDNGEFDREEEEEYRVYVIDLDEKSVIMDFPLTGYSKKVHTYYTDSTGAEVDPTIKSVELYEGATEEQKDSLDVLYATSLKNLNKNVEMEYIESYCSYRLEKNRIMVSCDVARKDIGQDPVVYDLVMEYVWVDHKWKLLNK